MNFLDLAQKRYSVREYSSKEIEEEKLKYILEAARIAPSACNRQPTQFLVITDKNTLKNIYTVYNRDWIKTAPCVIVAIGDHDKSWKRKDNKDHCDVDTAIAIDHLTLAACDKGLGTCWVCAFDSKLCHEILNLPPEKEVVVLIPVGYPATDNIPEKSRRDLDQIYKKI